MKFDISLWANVFLCMDGDFGRKQKSKLQFIVQIYKKSRRIFANDEIIILISFF